MVAGGTTTFGTDAEFSENGPCLDRLLGPAARSKRSWGDAIAAPNVGSG